MRSVVMSKLDRQLRQDGFSIGQISKGREVSLERFGQTLGHAVRLRIFNRRGRGVSIQSFGTIANLFGLCSTSRYRSETQSILLQQAHKLRCRIGVKFTELTT
jgi:hypothetical protein